ncbi:MAG: hypothetical protein KDD69_17915 [Bdellovibrionales bacterium]|nr:hypothetical protein [Bdellovibrionales bacterium]
MTVPTSVFQDAQSLSNTLDTISLLDNAEQWDALCAVWGLEKVAAVRSFCVGLGFCGDCNEQVIALFRCNGAKKRIRRYLVTELPQHWVSQVGRITSYLQRILRREGADLNKRFLDGLMWNLVVSHHQRPGQHLTRLRSDFSNFRARQEERMLPSAQTTDSSAAAASGRSLACTV